MRLLQALSPVALTCVLGVCGAWAQEKSAAPAGATATPALSQADLAKSIDAVLADLGSEDLKVRGDAKTKLEAMCFNASRPGAEGERAAMSKALAAKLGAASPQPSRVWFLRMLQNMGRAECVAAVTPLLADKDAEVRECARRALQHNPSAEAGAALRAELDKADAPAWKVAVVNALGARKDAAAVAGIAKLLADKEPSAAIAAARALGNIGGQEATKALSDARASASATVRPTVTDALLLCADKLCADGKKDEAAAIYQEMLGGSESIAVRTAGMRGLAIAKPEQAVTLICQAIAGTDEKLRGIGLSLVGELQGAEATKAIAALVAKVPPAVQVALLGALGGRGDAAAKPAVLEAAKSSDESVRAAAVGALGGIGDASDVPVLAKAVVSAAGAEADAAKGALVRLRGQEADAAMVKAMEGADVKVRTELILALVARKAPPALPAVLAACKDADDGLRVAAINGVGALGDDKILPTLIDLVVKAGASSRQRDAAESAMAAVCSRSAGKDACAGAILAAMSSADVPARCALLRVVAGTGTAKALQAVRESLKDPKPEIQEAAVKGLKEWPDPVAAPDLLAIAKDASLKPNLQILALQGYIRLAGTPQDKPAVEKMKMYQEAMNLAKRPEEKRQILSGLGEVRTLDSLRMIAPCLDVKEVQAEACIAAGKVAKDLENNAAARDDVISALEKVVTISKDKRLVGDAQKTLDKLKKAPPARKGT